MAKLKEKSSIYIDVQHLLKILYRGQFEMDKKDRIVLFPVMFGKVLDMLSNFCLAYYTESKKEYIDVMIADFECLKPLVRFCIEESMFKTPLTIKSLRERIVKIDEGVMKWRKYIVSSRQDQNPGGSGRTV